MTAVPSRVVTIVMPAARRYIFSWLRLVFSVIPSRSEVGVVTKKILILRKRKYRKSCYTLRRSHRDARETVDGIIFAFQGTSPNSRAAHPRQESPGSEGKDSVLLITAGVLILPLTNLGQTVTLFFEPRVEPSPVSWWCGASFQRKTE